MKEGSTGSDGLVGCFGYTELRKSGIFFIKLRHSVVALLRSQKSKKAAVPFFRVSDSSDRSDSSGRTLCSAVIIAIVLCACGGGDKKSSDHQTVLTFSGSALGAEGTLVAKQLKRFMAIHPDIRVELQRTPDDANQRHQLYVQWLNARVGNPDILQLDVIWTPEFAAAGWVLPLNKYGPTTSDFFPATIEANTWAGKLYALPWFADVGLL